ncbi:isoprenylcysteine carboxyl methyltransferase family protein [Neobacillus dielmonensis]|uniref:isoprenylcysteine carboxyl methyltransferase family protein n=1 Tax=Neobacillus dielmonensis TaxID=1347369 RepID=UPI0005A84D59|nr:isoprenylcysteine carboxylmethyltransferase family protein [Neobacillus dielmonensis]
MNDLVPFFSLFLFLIVQRFSELVLAKNNERWMKQRGGIEFGSNHYRYMVIMHGLFFLILILEKWLLNRSLSPAWQGLVLLFLMIEGLRIWAITALGRLWNTKIIIIPNIKVVKKGPYRFIKHPNYLVVSMEFLVVPILFQCYSTACLFTILNVIMLSVRITEEEMALGKLTRYKEDFKGFRRFVPRIVK